MSFVFRLFVLLAPLLMLVVCLPSYGGYLVGLGVGYDNSSFHKDITNKDDQSSYSANDRSETVNGQIIGGYSWALGQYLVEPRVNYTLNNTTHNYIGGSTHDIEDGFKFNFGLDVKLGYPLTKKWMPYVLMGWQLGDYIHNSTNKGTGETFGHQKYLNGFQTGVGVNYKISKSLFAGIDYTYSIFEKDYTGGNDDVSLVNKTIQPIIQQLVWNVGYSF